MRYPLWDTSGKHDKGKPFKELREKILEFFPFLHGDKRPTLIDLGRDSILAVPKLDVLP